ncbi:hypothetical protein IIZ81_02985 [Candidatus Saccharibacteria bacterium]|nr:hypothetical protein [Candidatus Saccharibacteria bacterium]
MKTEIIGKNGNVVAGQKDPKATYVEHDKDSVRIHLSETDKVTKDQIVAIGNLLAIAGKGKAMTQVTQHSKNVVGFTLAKEPDAAKSKASIQVAYNAVVAEAKRVNAQQNGGNNGAQQQSRGNQSGNGGQQSQGNQGQQNGGNAQQSNNNAQQPDKTKDIFGRPLKQSYPGLFWSGMSPQEEQSAFDSYWDMVHHVDKDIFHKK